jgi:hypothetical protein
MNYKLGRIKWIEQEYSWPLDGSRNGPNGGQLTEMTRTARRPLPLPVHSSTSRAEFRDSAGAPRGAEDAVAEAAQHCGERVPVDDNGAGIGGDLAVGELVGGGPVHVSRGRWAESITWAV